MKNAHKYDGIDFVGQRHGRLTVVGKSEKGRSWLVCKCDCGAEITIIANRFLQYKSCGCLEKENRQRLGSRTTTHGKAFTRLYAIYCGMKNRCYNPGYKHYSRYGGRGIKVCEEWLDSFEAFYNWALESGYDANISGKNQSIDRINLEGDYEPSNCRWANQTEQVRNRSNTRWVSFNGEKVNPYDFAREHGITNKSYIYRHLDRGETGEEILENWRNRKRNRNFQNGA